MSSVKKTRKKQLSSGKQKKEIRTRTRTTSKTAVSIYDYEIELNEEKQNIKLINSSYSNQLENDLKTLMAQ